MDVTPEKQKALGILQEFIKSAHLWGWRSKPKG